MLCADQDRQYSKTCLVTRNPFVFTNWRLLFSLFDHRVQSSTFELNRQRTTTGLRRTLSWPHWTTLMLEELRSHSTKSGIASGVLRKDVWLTRPSSRDVQQKRNTSTKQFGTSSPGKRKNADATWQMARFLQNPIRPHPLPIWRRSGPRVCVTLRGHGTVPLLVAINMLVNDHDAQA